MGAWGGKRDTSSGGPPGKQQSRGERGGQAEVRPTVLGGSPRGDLDAKFPLPAQVSSALSLNFCLPYPPILQALGRSLSP